MAADLADHVDDTVPDILRQFRQLVLAELPHVVRAFYAVKQ
jgi:hypothetical protein